MSDCPSCFGGKCVGNALVCPSCTSRIQAGIDAQAARAAAEIAADQDRAVNVNLTVSSGCAIQFMFLGGGLAALALLGYVLI